MVGYAYAMEFFIAWYSGNAVRALHLHEPRLRPVRLGLLDDDDLQRDRRRSSSGSRRCAPASRSLFVLSIFVNIGMWFERFVIIVTSLHRDFLPSSWGYFTPTLCRHRDLHRQLRPVLHAVLLFVRFLPMVATAEVKTVLPQAIAHPHEAPQIEHAPAAGGRSISPAEEPPDGPARAPACRPASSSARSPSSPPRPSSTTPARACATPATPAGTRTRRSLSTGSIAPWASSLASAVGRLW